MPFAAETVSDGAGLWDWAEPLVHDVLREAYEAAFTDGDDAREAALAHADLWRALANGVGDADAASRLESALARAENGLALFNDANAAVVAELAETVRRRYRTSLRSRAVYERALNAFHRSFAFGR